VVTDERHFIVRMIIDCMHQTGPIRRELSILQYVIMLHVYQYVTVSTALSRNGSCSLWSLEWKTTDRR